MLNIIKGKRQLDNILFSSLIKYSCSYLYKFGGIQQFPSQTCEQAQLQDIFQNLLNIQSSEVFKDAYTCLLSAIHQKDMQKLKEIMHPQIPGLQMTLPNTRLLNYNDFINIKYGNCRFGFSLNSIDYLGFKLSQIEDPRPVKQKVSIFSPINYEIAEIKKQKMSFNYIKNLFKTQQLKIRVQVQLFFNSKIKLRPAVQTIRQQQENSTQIHQMKMRMEGSIPKKRLLI